MKKRQPSPAPEIVGWYAVTPTRKRSAVFWAAWWTAKPSVQHMLHPDATGSATPELAPAEAESAIRAVKGKGAGVLQIGVIFAEAVRQVHQSRRRDPTRAVQQAAEREEKRRQKREAARPAPKWEDAPPRKWPPDDKPYEERARLYWLLLDVYLSWGETPRPPHWFDLTVEPDPPDEYCKRIAQKWTPEARAWTLLQARARRHREEQARVQDRAQSAPSSRAAGAESLAHFGLALPCTVDDVRRAYRRAVARDRVHPDQGGDAAAFGELTARCDMAIAYVERGGLEFFTVRL